MILCFAYGSNMDRDAMAERCPAARLVGPARLERHRLAVMREGYATIVPDPGRHVWGVLWDLAFPDVAALDRYEEVGRGLYRKLHLPVVADGRPCRALVYVGSNAGPGAMAADALVQLLRAAEAVGLPEGYRTMLEALPTDRREVTPAGPVREAPRVRPTRATPFDAPKPTQPVAWRWEP